MKQHKGQHIIRGDVEANVHLCGFCGAIGCNLDLVRTSGKGKNSTFKASSDCPFYKAFSLKSASKMSKNSPFTNRPAECTICTRKNRVYWSYNILIHYKTSHSNVEPPNYISEEEKKELSLCIFVRK